MLRLLSPAILLMAFAVPASSQQENQIEVAKLDRIPPQPAFAGQTRAPSAGPSQYAVETVIDGLSGSWSLAFLPDGAILLTENGPGRLRVLGTDRKLSPPLAGIDAIHSPRNSRIFDVTLDPEFDANGYIYFTAFVAPEERGGRGISRLVRARLDREALAVTDLEFVLEDILHQEIHFAPDGHLLAAGRATQGTSAQDLSHYAGKLLRITRDGRPAADNPWIDDPAVPSEVFTRGHRDFSGFATHPVTGEIWATEHGPRGGDELNIIRAGRNYGWPVISYGTQYDGSPVGSGAAAADGMEQPVYFWQPSIAPTGIIFYTGDMFPQWQRNAFITAASGQHIARLILDGNRVIGEERLLVERAERIRELRQGPDGALYALTEAERGAPRGSSNPALLRIFRESPETAVP